MLSVEEYYEEHLKGKSVEDIKKCIRRLKIQMNKMKKTIICEDYFLQDNANDLSTIKMLQMYVDRAIQAIEDLGEKYVYTKKELLVKEINDNLPYLSEVGFFIGKILEGKPVYKFYFDDDSIERKIYVDDVAQYKIYDKEAFIKGLASLRIGEWNRHYGKRDDIAAQRWTLTLVFSNGYKEIYIRGIAGFPYNFDDLLELVGVIRDDEVEEEEGFENKYSVDYEFIDTLLHRMCTKMKELPVGTEICTAQLLDLVTEQHEYVYGDFIYEGVTLNLLDMFMLDYELKTKAEEQGIIIDNTIHEHEVLGLPFNIGFLIEEN